MRTLVTLAAFLSVVSVASAQDATTPGEVTAPHPTLENISIEWAISGDADADGVVTVRYRQAGAAEWRSAMPLVRVPAGSNEGHSWANRHAGSVLDLWPDTEYEIELSLDDPDGGSETRTLSVRTRPVPRAAPDAREREVTPETFAEVASSAEAGDLLLLGPGTYAGLTFGADGTVDRPIVIRGASAEEVTISGDVRLDGRSHVYLEHVTVEGQVKFNNATGIVVRACTIRTMRDGIVSLAEGSTDGYFADNSIFGPTTWYDGALGVSGDNLGEGVWVTGPGNVIAHNRVVGFRDNISLLEDTGASNQVSIDIVGNDIDGGADDCIEADFAMGNVRVMRNRMTNCFMGASSQPSLGGPTYFVRNAMYNVVLSPFKLQRSSVGDVLLHNTVVKCGDAFAVYTSDVWSRAYARNNLFIGGEGGGTYGGYSNGSGRVAVLATADGSCSFDYDGYGSIGTGTFAGRIGGVSFSSLAEMRSMTSEAHAVEVDMSVFAATVGFPSSGPFPAREAPDLRLADGSAAVDRGVAIAGVNDGFAGSAPDLGAYEAGSALPAYGPRPDGEPMPGTDAGVAGPDGGGPRVDGGGPSRDAASGSDAGPTSEAGDDGCGCRVDRRANPSVALLLYAALIALALRRRR